MNKALKWKFSRIAAVALSLLLALGVLTSLSVLSVRADDEDSTFTPEFTQTAVTVENNQFASGSGSFPKTPDSWTGAEMTGKITVNSESFIGGIMDLNSYNSNLDAYKLKDDYPDDFTDGKTPQSPFGTSSYPDTNKNVLLLNARPAASQGLAYGYTSGTLTFAANKFYSLQVWVKTGGFADGGAAIRLNGLDDDVAFSDIDTTLMTADGADYGWQKYSFYIAAPSFGTKTVSLSLQIGDRYEDKDGNITYRPASGYAFFDNITAYEISPADFYDQKSGVAQENTLLCDYSSLKNYLSEDADSKYEDENWNFAQKGADGTPVLSSDDWRLFAEESTSLSDVKSGVFSTYHYSESSLKELNLKENPSSSLGNFEPDSEILFLTSYTGGGYKNVAAGFRSKDITIERFKYYRISAWVKTQDVTGGDGATMVLSAVRDPNNRKVDLAAKTTGMTGDGENAARAGWKEYAFYVKGSSVRDYTVNLDLMLGTEGKESAGIALFDNITVTGLTPQEYADNSANGTLVDVDTDKGPDGSTEFWTFTDTGITNSEFYKAGTYTDYEFPMMPADWTRYTVDTVGTTGFSTETGNIDPDKMIGGLMPTDDAYYNKYHDSGAFGTGVFNPRPATNGSLLLLASPDLTAFCYRSASFTVAADKAGKVVVSLYADNMDAEDYGASLVLKSGANVVATVEGIKNTNGFKDYTFYIEGASADTADLTVEIWLGLNDRDRNQSKLSSGYVYVQKATYAELAEGETYADKKANLSDRSAAYSFKAEDFTAFDRYESGFIKTPYNWTNTITGADAETVKFGIFNPRNGLGDQSVVPPTFEADEKTSNKNVLFLKNTVPAACKLTLSTKYKMKADTYYKISVNLKVDIPEQNDSAVGAGITLTGGSKPYKFENVINTAEVHDQTTYEEVFRTFTFYVSPGSTETDVGLEITLGDESTPSKYCSGIVYVSDISVTDITNVLFEDKTSDEALEDNVYDKKVILNESTTDDETGDSGETAPSDWQLQWWLIPSILFAVAILIAVVGYCVRRILEKKAKNKTYETVTSYDRNATLNKDFNDQAANDADKISGTEARPADDRTYDSFNDDGTAPDTIPETKKAVNEPADQYDSFSDEPDGAAEAKGEAGTAEPKQENESAEAEQAATGEPPVSDAQTKENDAQAENKKTSPAYHDEFDD